MFRRIFNRMLVFSVVAIAGCGYTLGTQTLHDVRTVHVPVFKSESSRRNLDYLLTEAVQREIRTRTPYRLEDAETADTILKGRIVEIRKSVLSETRYDDPRELQLMLGAEVTWVDRRSGQILHQQTFPVGPQLTPAGQQCQLRTGSRSFPCDSTAGSRPAPCRSHRRSDGSSVVGQTDSRPLKKRPLECGDSSPLSFSGNLAVETMFVCTIDFT